MTFQVASTVMNQMQAAAEVAQATSANKTVLRDATISSASQATTGHKTQASKAVAAVKTVGESRAGTPEAAASVNMDEVKGVLYRGGLIDTPSDSLLDVKAIEGTKEVQFKLATDLVVFGPGYNRLKVQETNPADRTVVKPEKWGWGAAKSVGETDSYWCVDMDTMEISYHDLKRDETVVFHQDGVLEVNGQRLTKNQFAMLCDLRHRLENCNKYYGDDEPQFLLKLQDLTIHTTGDNEAIFEGYYDHKNNDYTNYYDRSAYKWTLQPNGEWSYDENHYGHYGYTPDFSRFQYQHWGDKHESDVLLVQY